MPDRPYSSEPTRSIQGHDGSMRGEKEEERDGEFCVRDFGGRSSLPDLRTEDSFYMGEEEEVGAADRRSPDVVGRRFSAPYPKGGNGAIVAGSDGGSPRVSSPRLEIPRLFSSASSDVSSSLSSRESKRGPEGGRRYNGNREALCPVNEGGLGLDTANLSGSRSKTRHSYPPENAGHAHPSVPGFPSYRPVGNRHFYDPYVVPSRRTSDKHRQSIVGSVYGLSSPISPSSSSRFVSGPIIPPTRSHHTAGPRTSSPRNLPSPLNPSQPDYPPLPSSQITPNSPSRIVSSSLCAGSSPSDVLHPVDGGVDGDEELQRPELPHFTSWDPTWYSGGYSADGHGWTTRPPPEGHVIIPTELPIRDQGDLGVLDNEGGLEVNPRPRWVGVYTADGPFIEAFDQDPHHEDFDEHGREAYRAGVGYDDHQARSLRGVKDGGKGKRNEDGRGTKGRASTGRLLTDKEIERRVKLLEAEFGSSGKGKHSAKQSMEAMMKEAKEKEKAEMAKSGVDVNGRLLTAGSKKRATLRILQGLLAAGAIVGSIGAGLFTHPSKSPPPAGKPPLFFLYGLSVISFLVTLWFFVFRPCCVSSRQKNANMNPMLSNMMFPVLAGGGGAYGPLAGGGNNSGCCCFGRRKSGPGQRRGGKGMAQPMNVNLIVDPTLFAPQQQVQAQLAAQNQRTAASASESKRLEKERARKRRRRRRRRQRRRDERMRSRMRREDDGLGNEYDSAYEWDLVSHTSDETTSTEDEEDEKGDESDEADPWSFYFPKSTKETEAEAGGGEWADPRKAAVIEARWTAARKQVRVMVWIDIVMAIAWLLESVWLLGFGEKCSPGDYQGWCNLYNVAVACAVMISLCFFGTFGFGVKDLRASRKPPRAALGIA